MFVRVRGGQQPCRLPGAIGHESRPDISRIRRGGQPIFFGTGGPGQSGKPLQIRAQLHLPENYFLASARFVEKKNLLGLVRAYGQYRQIAPPEGSRKSWGLVLLGDGEFGPQIRRLVADLSLEDSVRLPGFKQYPELPAYYGLAGAFVHASVTEQWGLVVNEAMGFGPAHPRFEPVRLRRGLGARRCQRLHL